MQNVIIVGKWATSKRPVVASKTQGVVTQKQPDRVNNKQGKSTGGRNTVKTVQPLETESLEEYPLHQLTQNSGSNPIELNVNVHGKTISMELAGYWSRSVSDI